MFRKIILSVSAVMVLAGWAQADHGRTNVNVNVDLRSAHDVDVEVGITNFLGLGHSHHGRWDEDDLRRCRRYGHCGPRHGYPPHYPYPDRPGRPHPGPRWYFVCYAENSRTGRPYDGDDYDSARWAQQEAMRKCERDAWRNEYCYETGCEKRRRW